MFRSARVVLLAAALVVPALTVHQKAAAAGGVGQKAYYLALGDSLAFGYQPTDVFSKGYADDWFNTTLKLHGTKYLINLSCNGETTTTFIQGGCVYPFHKIPYRTNQLQRALQFIKNHHGQVSPVSVDIGANDVVAGLDASTCSITNTQAMSNIEATFNANYTSILTQLKKALSADGTLNGTPTGDLFTMNYYNPYQNQCAGNPQVFQLFKQFNADLAADAAAVGVPMADVYTAFGGDGDLPNNMNSHITGTPDGSCPSNNWITSSSYTWICTNFNSLPGSNIHPTALGYQKIANAFEMIAGY
jgi:lysophospholipase L1-like esterase